MIEIINLNQIYNYKKVDEFQALKDINLHIKKGEIIVLNGVSGSGKSTLLSLIAAFSHPTSGDIKIDDKSIGKLPDIYASQYRNQRIGFVFQSFNLIEQLTVEENILAPLLLASHKNVDELLKNALNLANITHKKDQIVSNLSGGEKQRTAIARAIVNNPDIILADEPTANLDKNNSLQFIDILKKFKQLGKTVVLATHDKIFDDLEFVDRYIHIENGQIV